MKADGVPVTMSMFPGQIHGFFSNGKMLPKAVEAADQVSAALKAAFAS